MPARQKSNRKPSEKPYSPARDWIETSQGKEGINYQRAAQITWWSILQGLSVAALAEKIPGIVDTITKSGTQWYLGLYVIVCLMIIVNVWIQMAWAILIFRWPINFPHTTLILLLGLSVYLSCLYVDNPLYWCLTIAFVILSAILVHLYNIRNQVVLDLPDAPIKVTIGIYVAYLLFSLGAFIYLLNCPSDLAKTLIGAIFFVATISSWLSQWYYMEKQRKARGIAA